jgi:transcriptional regulator with XRE-family HTH domain
VWSLDIDLADKRLAIEWSDATGFGVSNVTADNFGERPDEAFLTLAEVQRRVTQLLTTVEQTSPPFGVSLGRLRERRGVTQQELARRLGVRQASVSGLERRDDVQLSTLGRVVAALGGSLEIYGRFPEALYRIEICPSEDKNQANSDIDAEETREIEHAPHRNFYDYEQAFPLLRDAGRLKHVTKIASDISSRCTVIEMPLCEP